MPRARRKQILGPSFRNRPSQHRSKSHNDAPGSYNMKHPTDVEGSGLSSIKAGPPNRDTHRRIAECRKQFDKLVQNDEQSKIFKETCSCVKEAAIKAMAALEMCAGTKERVEPHLSKLSIDAMATFSRGAGRIIGYGNMSLLQRWTHPKAKVKEKLLSVARQLEIIAQDAWDLADGIPLAKQHRDIRFSVASDMNFSLVRKRIYKSPKKIRQLIFAPTRGGSDGRVVLWSVDGCLYRHDIPSGVTTSISTKVVGSPVLCMTVDSQYRIWTGHRGGLAKCWSEHSEAVLAEAQCMGADIRAIVTTSSGIAWIGCHLGGISRLKCHESSSGSLWIENLGPVVITTSNKHGNSSLAVDLLESVKRAYSGMTDMLAHMGRVRCMLARDDSVWSSGGDQRSSSSLRVWNGAGEETCVKNLNAFGACDAMFDLAWDEKVFSEEGCQWRLLTGHETGELVLWFPRSLIPMVKIGPRAPPVRSIFVVDCLGLLFTAHQDGSIRFRNMIVPDNGAPGLFSSSHHCGCVADERLHKHLPPFGEFKAHRSRLTHAVGAIDSLVSASSRGTVSCWPASVLEQEALKAGIQVVHRTNGRSLKRDKTVKWLNRPTLSGGDSRFNVSVMAADESSSVDEDFQGGSSSNHDGEDWNQFDSQDLEQDSSVEKTPLSLVDGDLPSINLDQGAWDLECKTATLLGGRTSIAREEDNEQVEKPRSRVVEKSKSDTLSSQFKSPFVDVTTPFDSPKSLSNQDLKTMFSQRMSGELIRQSSGECSVTRDVSAEQIIIDAADLQFDQDPRKSLGVGAFGVVYKGKAFMTDAAIKVLNQSNLLDEASQSMDIGEMDVTDIDVDEAASLAMDLETENDSSSRWQGVGGKPLRALVREAGLMLQLRHPHIVLFLGVCLDPPALVTEFCGKGSLFTLLQKASAGVEQAKNSLTWHRILTMAHEAALGVHYLHRHHVEHRDLKSLNLLVDEHFRIKVADFGTSKFMLNENKWSDSVHATNPRWLPPEAMKSNTYGFKADVYAFGIVLWELLTWQMPWESDSGDRPCHPLQLFKWVMEGLRPNIPNPEDLPAGPCPVYDEYIALMKICWAQDPAERPHFDTITKCLEDMLAKISESKDDDKRRSVLITSPSYTPSVGGQQSPRDGSSPMPPPSSPFGAVSPRQAPPSPFSAPRRPESPFARPAALEPVSSVGGDSMSGVPPSPGSPLLRAPVSPRQPPTSPFSTPTTPFSLVSPPASSLEGGSTSVNDIGTDTSQSGSLHGCSFNPRMVKSFGRKRSAPSDGEGSIRGSHNGFPSAYTGVQSAPMEIEQLLTQSGSGGARNPPRSSWSTQDSQVPPCSDPPCDSDISVPQEQGAVSDQELSLVLSRLLGEGKNRHEALKRVSDALRLFEDTHSKPPGAEFQDQGLEGPLENLEKCSAQQVWCKEGELT